MRGMFGNGWTIMGHHSQHVELLDNNEGIKVNFCSVERVTFSEQIENEISCSYSGTRDYQFLDAVSTESIGVSIPPKCTACKAKTENCKECKMKTEMMTYLEYLQDQQISESIEYIPNEKRYVASYPYTQEVYNLLPNNDIAMKRAISFEKNILKKPEDLELLNKSLFDSFERGLFRFLPDDEIENWDGPIHYIPMNRVYKESDSTPVRLIFDSGQPDRNGRSLNGCMGKGTNPLNHFGSRCITVSK